MTHGIARAALALMLLAVGASAATEAEDLVRRAETPRVTATLAPELAVAAPGERVTLVLHQRILDGWHTYWENPGDSGQRIDIAWTLPDGVEAGELTFPVPEPIRYGPLMNHGYSGETAVLATLTIPSSWRAGRPLPVQAHASWLVCKDVCIPEEARFALTLPTADASAPLERVRGLFAEARAQLPALAPWSAELRDTGDDLLLVPDANVDLDGAWFFAREWGRLEHAAEQRVRRVDGRNALVLTRGEAPSAATLEGVLRLANAPSTNAPPGVTLSLPVRVVGSAAAPVSGVTTPIENPGTLMLLLLAFAGGVLLNLMPCVFPVLAMKAMSVLHHGGATRSALAAGGIAYTAGVIASFALLAAALIALKAGGEAVGWGFHLQHPGVVATLALVLFGVGLNLSGVLAVSGAWSGAGSTLAARPGLTGSFFTGVLAAVVAAPCTAPFMATAIGIALLQSTGVAMAVFVALGAGLAAPYLLLTCVPRLSAWLPRPGSWMERLKQLLAFPMYASAVWLTWVLAQQSGADAVGLTLLAMVVLALAGFCWRSAAGAGSTTRRAARAAGVAAAAGALMLVLFAGSLPPSAHDAVRTSGALAERYDPARIDAVLANGGAVLLNVTAAWCVTCKFNERVALSGDAFEHALEEHGVIYMKGDWTRRDPQLTTLLERFGRAGVPLYVLFPRGGAAPRVLPQILTGSIVGEALARA